MSELRNKMTRAMQLKDFSDRTQETYLGAVKGIAKFYGKSPALLNQQQVDDYLLHLRQSGKSASTRNVAICGLRFYTSRGIEQRRYFFGISNTQKTKDFTGGSQYK